MATTTSCLQCSVVVKGFVGQNSELPFYCQERTEGGTEPAQLSLVPFTIHVKDLASRGGLSCILQKLKIY